MVTRQEARVWSDLAIPPGELLREELDAIGMTQLELAERAGRPAQTISEIVGDKKRITHETALDLEKVLGIPAHVWVNLEANYQLARARLREASELARQQEWLDRFPMKELLQRGWLPDCATPADKVRELLKFLGVTSLAAWKSAVVGFRITPKAKVSEEALAAWLRKGELDGRDVATATYSEVLFRQALTRIRQLTMQNPEDFIPRLKEECSKAGVATVFVQELPGSAAHGAARWLTPAKALIQLSLRYKTNDHLWFTFFHESGHILRHAVRDIHIDGVDGSANGEDEADEFARDFLIPPAAWAEFVASQAFGEAAIRQFAERVRIAPGIVVGRLQYEDLLGWNSGLNRLKVRYRWA